FQCTAPCEDIRTVGTLDHRCSIGQVPSVRSCLTHQIQSRVRSKRTHQHLFFSFACIEPYFIRLATFSLFHLPFIIFASKHYRRRSVRSIRYGRMEESIRLAEVRHRTKLKLSVRLPRNHSSIME